MKGVGEMFYWVGREESVGKLVCIGGKVRREGNTYKTYLLDLLTRQTYLLDLFTRLTY